MFPHLLLSFLSHHGECCFSWIITSRLSEWGRNSPPIWMGGNYASFFSIPSSPCLTNLSVTAKSSTDFDPNVVLFDDKCKWLTLKLEFWLKFSKAIHGVLDSPVCLSRITDILGAGFHTCIQNGDRYRKKKNLQSVISRKTVARVSWIINCGEQG